MPTIWPRRCYFPCCQYKPRLLSNSCRVNRTKPESLLEPEPFFAIGPERFGRYLFCAACWSQISRAQQRSEVGNTTGCVAVGLFPTKLKHPQGNLFIPFLFLKKFSVSGSPVAYRFVLRPLIASVSLFRYWPNWTWLSKAKRSFCWRWIKTCRLWGTGGFLRSLSFCFSLPLFFQLCPSV